VGEKRVNRIERTRDISSGGVCFASSSDIEIGGKIEYLITLSSSTPPVRIRCLGKVLRSHKSASDAPFEIAVTMERYQFVRPEEEAATAAVSA
jgi:hypothetical protein